MVSPAFFITGTDTNVGKTYVTCLLATAIQKTGKFVGVCKPVATGSVDMEGEKVSEDALCLQEASGCQWDLDKINPVCLEKPLSPNWAAKQEGKKVNPAKLIEHIQTLRTECETLLVEGIGGVKVPLTENYFVLDLMKDLNYPAIVVSGNRLGAINHTLLTLDALIARGVPLGALVLNRIQEGDDPAKRTNAENLRAFLPPNLPLVEFSCQENFSSPGLKKLMVMLKL